ncbi:MAG TPA: hypothetical protein DCZ69_09865 [Syntrophobacteraceae bacterium]|nr:hypothetical protein [Syntrophobacteraceae bacterium]HBD08557.1 hypothetical protein [Syntrophobacteraceae bacterium]HBZ55316.1 hypothetical protein [Syntrophobacteraceae bacterium]
MKVSKLFHRCGCPILHIRQQVGPAEKSFFVDANNPVIESSDGKRSPRVIERCPQCKGFVKLEKLYSEPPSLGTADTKAPTGYMPARMGSDDPPK